MTRIKLCGITELNTIDAVNELKPEYIGFVFAKKSKRFLTPENAEKLKKGLDRAIQAVGVFVDAPEEQVAELLNNGIIDMAQLHGREDESYIQRLRCLTDKPIIKAFVITGKEDIERIEKSSADYVLVDSGTGSGKAFDWSLTKEIKRPFFLAGGLNAGNVDEAVMQINPYAVDVSSGIEANGHKDKEKMTAFVDAVRKHD